MTHSALPFIEFIVTASLRLFVINEAHLHATHERAFCVCICVLHTKFFSVVLSQMEKLLTLLWL